MSKSKRVTAIIAMCIGMFMCLLNETIMNIVLPEIQTGLHTNLSNMTWAINAYTIIFAALSIPFGRLAERFGRNKSFIAGALIFLVGAVVAACAPSIGVLILGRSIQAFGVAFVFPLSMVIGISTVSVKQRAGVIAALTLTQGLASAAGPTIGGSIANFFSWRWVFIINIPMALLTIALSLYALNFKETVHHSKIDVVGSLLSIITLSALTLGLVQGRSWGWSSLSIIGLFVLSAVSLLIFIPYESHIENPMIPMELFKDRQFNGATLSMLLGTVFFIGVLVVAPTYFVRLQNTTDLVAALLITPADIAICVFSPMASTLVNKLGGRWAIFSGAIFMGLSYILLWNINMTNHVHFGIAIAILGAGYGIIIGAMQTLGAANFKGKLLSASQPVILVMRLIGFALAASIFITALSNNASPAKQHSISYAKSEVTRLALPAKQSSRMKHTIASRIRSQKTTKDKKFKVSESKKSALVNKALEKVPAQARTQFKPKVQSAVNKKVAKTENKINRMTPKIRHHTKSEFSKAFTNIYKVATPFVFALALILFIFKRRKQQV